MKYEKLTKLSIRSHPELSERWVQERIADDPSILGLGDVTLKDKERIQPSTGRLHFIPDGCLERRNSRERERPDHPHAGQVLPALYHHIYTDGDCTLFELDPRRPHREVREARLPADETAGQHGHLRATLVEEGFHRAIREGNLGGRSRNHRGKHHCHEMLYHPFPVLRRMGSPRRLLVTQSINLTRAFDNCPGVEPSCSPVR
jgi:hypothetical protein